MESKEVSKFFTCLKIKDTVTCSCAFPLEKEDWFTQVKMSKQSPEKWEGGRALRNNQPEWPLSNGTEENPIYID